MAYQMAMLERQTKKSSTVSIRGRTYRLICVDVVARRKARGRVADFGGT